MFAKFKVSCVAIPLISKVQNLCGCLSVSYFMEVLCFLHITEGLCHLLYISQIRYHLFRER